MDTLKKTMNFNDFAIASVKGSDYRIFFFHLERDDRKKRERFFGNVMSWYMWKDVQNWKKVLGWVISVGKEYWQWNL